MTTIFVNHCPVCPLLSAVARDHNDPLIHRTPRKLSKHGLFVYCASMTHACLVMPARCICPIAKSNQNHEDSAASLCFSYYYGEGMVAGKGNVDGYLTRKHVR